MLAEAGVDHGDASYEGEQSTSVLSLDYYRNKAREFQDVLNQVDTAARAAREAIAAGVDDDLTRDLVGMLGEFDAKKAIFRMAAEGINAAAAVINAAGGRFPQLSVPSGLGALPFVVPAPGIAAIAVAATLITWGVSWIDGVKQRLLYAQLTGKGTPEQQAALARSLALAEAAQRSRSESPLASVAGIVKWVAIAGVAWIAWSAWEKSR